MTADPKKAARAALYVARNTFADGGDAEPQSITSADTSIKQVPAVFKSPLFRKTPGQRNLDIGGGKYDLGRDYLAQHGVESHVYDPYNREPEHNEAVLKRFSDKPADSVTATNVLNVIQHPHHRAGVIEMAHRHLDDNGHAYFGIYAGDRSGQGKQTSKGYQNNLPASAYMDEVQRLFPHVQRKGDVIVARKKSFSSGGEVYSNHAPRRTMQSPAVAELKHLLTMHRNELRNMKGRTQYAAIDGIMKRISREHGIAPSKLHDDWISVYHQTPDAWVAGDHGSVVDRALKMTNRGGYAFGGSPAALASATGAPINFAPAAGAFTGLPLPKGPDIAPSKATLAAILASRPTTYTGSSKPLESKYIGPSIPAPTFNASAYNLPDNPLEEGQGGGYGGIRDYGGGGNGGGGGGGAGGMGGGGPSARGGRIHRANDDRVQHALSLTRHAALPGRQHARGGPVKAFHSTYEPFKQYDWSRLGQVTKENAGGMSHENWAANLAQIGPWAHERALKAEMAAPHTLPVELSGKGKSFQSLDSLEKAVRKAGSPKQFRAQMVEQGYGHLAVKDTEFGGKSFIGLSPDTFKIIPE